MTGTVMHPLYDSAGGRDESGCPLHSRILYHVNVQERKTILTAVAKILVWQRC